MGVGMARLSFRGPTNPLPPIATVSIHEYQVRFRKDCLGVDLISDALPFRCALLSGKDAAADAIDYANLFSGSHAAVIRVYNAAGKLIETHEHKVRFQRVVQRSTLDQVCATEETPQGAARIQPAGSAGP
jgi:hypothetical protein